MIILQKCMDLPKFVPGSYNETCLTPDDESQIINVKVEITDEQDEEDPVPITCPVIKPEHEVSCVCGRVCTFLDTFHKSPGVAVLLIPVCPYEITPIL
jgi:hypothetical protein